VQDVCQLLVLCFEDLGLVVPGEDEATLQKFDVGVLGPVLLEFVHEGLDFCTQVELYQDP